MKIIYCSKCGGVITSELPMGVYVWCRCSQHKNLPTGWICPRCSKVHSPYSTVCDCQPYIESRNTSGSI